ncbi:MAG: helix-turn-helix domain-containing protein [Bacillota bacterium]
MISKKLKELRKNNSLKQKELAKKLGLTQQTISKYESGIRTPNYEILVKIANEFNVSIDYLLGRVDYKRSANISKIDDYWELVKGSLIETILPRKFVNGYNKNMSLVIDELSKIIEKDKLKEIKANNLVDFFKSLDEILQRQVAIYYIANILEYSKKIIIVYQIDFGDYNAMQIEEIPLEKNKEGKIKDKFLNNSQKIKVPVIEKLKVNYLNESNIVYYDEINKELFDSNGEYNYFYLDINKQKLTGNRIKKGDRVLVKDEPDIKSGDKIIIKKEQNYLLSKAVNAGGKIFLQPFNNTDSELLPKTEIEIVGKIIKVEIYF